MADFNPDDFKDTGEPLPASLETPARLLERLQSSPPAAAAAEAAPAGAEPDLERLRELLDASLVISDVGKLFEILELARNTLPALLEQVKEMEKIRRWLSERDKQASGGARNADVANHNFVVLVRQALARHAGGEKKEKT